MGLAVFGLLVVSIVSFPSLGNAKTVLAPSVQAEVLTPDAGDGYVLAALPDAVTVTAPIENVGSNLRVVFWDPELPRAADATTCATWSEASSEAVQQGAALRVGSAPGGEVQAVTVTKNVGFAASWIFNVHVWGPARGEVHPVGQVDLGSVFAADGDPQFPRALPWRMCARTQGATVQFKVWRRSEAEPAWTDRNHGAVVALPADAPVAGAFGGFIGHLHPGMTATFTELTDRAIPVGAAFVPADDPTADLAGPAR